MIFSTAESLTSADTDEAQDLYARSGGTTTLLSTGPNGGNGPADALFAKASNDGSRVFFTTTESLVTEDTDSSTDVYERSGGATTLVSTGTVGGNGPFGVGLHAVSANGSRAFMSTLERLTSEDDFAGEEDVYSHSGGGTLLVSVRNDPDLELGPPPPTLTKTEPGSPGESTELRVVGQAAFGATIKIYANSQCSEVPVATGTRQNSPRRASRSCRPGHDDQLLGDGGSAKESSPPVPRAASPTHRKKRCLLRPAAASSSSSSRRRKTERKKHRRRQKQRRIEKGLFQRRDHLRDAPDAGHLRPKLQDEEETTGLPLLRRDRPAGHDLPMPGR